jgi:hypothetical protein
MTLDALGDVNYLAVVVAAAVYFILGALWYAPPVFGNRWQAASKADVSGGANPLIFLVTFVLWFVVALALAWLAVLIGVESAAGGLGLGLVAGVGFMLPSLLVSSMYEQTSPTVTAIGAGYNLVGFALAGLIIGAWT